ncbi:MAG TPA: Uma2 family endonuclease [Pyrinomonadaceae bacterium]|jgi:Uma2 family endonuclease|nr:Uma2 family endonuclease [Pyrinomonadaceae bacterium]
MEASDGGVMVNVLNIVESPPLLVHLRPAVEMTDEQFFEFCQINRDLRIERTAEGDLLIMPPTGARTGRRNNLLAKAFLLWEEQDRTGLSFDSSTGFILPNGAKRSPDVSWVKRSRLAALSDEQKEKFLPLCPDVVVELRSSSDSLDDLKAKMREYVDNGAQLGWLIDLQHREAYVYLSDGQVERMSNPESLSGDPVLPGFILHLGEIWEVDL